MTNTNLFTSKRCAFQNSRAAIFHSILVTSYATVHIHPAHAFIREAAVSALKVLLPYMSVLN